jgi:type IV secretion system protein VirB10
MPVKETGDPRLQALFGTTDPRDASVKPVVRLPGKGVPPLAVAIGALALAIILFMVLNSRRTGQAAPTVQPQISDKAGSARAPPPPLYVPPAPQPVVVPVPIEAQHPVPPFAMPPPQAVPIRRTMVVPPTIVQPAPQVAPIAAPVPAATQRVSSGSPLVIDTASTLVGSTQNARTVGAKDADGSSAQPTVRMRASAFANRSMTVPQGYLIPAVLETGFDSTKPGYARAIVSRDVHGFDGKNVLIPRGSRLVGEYKSAMAQGQNRAVINWTRLIRPDGMTIAMDAPVVDTVGRGGVAASVNTHFFSRLGDALLQSTFSIGQALAGRAVTGPVVVLSGNATGSMSQLAMPHANYVPTLKVPPGKSISIFVAQDLDFSAAGVGR